MYVIGLTGNIATGKSTVAAMLERLGAYVIDADKLAHSTMRSGNEAHAKVVERFGRDILDACGEIDRGALAKIVFADPQALADLEGIVHPEVVRETLRLFAESEAAVGVVEAIKLIEAGMHHRCDAVWVVTSTREQQIDRLMSTRGLTRSQALLRIDAQAPAHAKAAQADLIIDNSGTLEETWSQVRSSWRRIPGAALPPEEPCTPPCDRAETP